MSDRSGFAFLRVILLVVTAVFISSGPSVAKQKIQQQHSSDPCAGPRGYVSDHIRRIKALLASRPNTQSSLFDIFSNQRDFEIKKSLQISELRYDAEVVNAMLRAGGCEAFDIDRELSPHANSTKETER